MTGEALRRPTVGPPFL